MTMMQLPAIGFGGSFPVRFGGDKAKGDVMVPVVIQPQIPGLPPGIIPPQQVGEVKPPLAFWQAQPKIVEGLVSVLSLVKAQAEQFADDFSAGAAKMLATTIEVIDEAKAKAKAGLEAIAQGQIPSATDQHAVKDWVDMATRRGEVALGTEMDGWAARHANVCGTGDPKDASDHAFRDGFMAAQQPVAEAMGEAQKAIEQMPETIALLERAKADLASQLGGDDDGPDGATGGGVSIGARGRRGRLN